MADRIANTFDEAAEPAWDFAASPYRPDLVVINPGVERLFDPAASFAR